MEKDLKVTISEAKQFNPLVLAFLGDAIYEVFARMYVTGKNRERSVHKLHIDAIGFVKAHEQSNIIMKIKDNLTSQEYEMFKRGRNAKSGTVPKNADVRDYRNATGFETLVGFLYITEQKDRLDDILKMVENVKENNSLEVQK